MKNKYTAQLSTGVLESLKKGSKETEGDKVLGHLWAFPHFLRSAKQWTMYSGLYPGVKASTHTIKTWYLNLPKEAWNYFAAAN